MRLLAVALFALLALPQPAHAEWQRIETREFALQADMEPEAIRALGLQLLDLDRLLRELFGVTGPGRGRRVEMIMYGDQAQLMTEAGMPGFATGGNPAFPVAGLRVAAVIRSGPETGKPSCAAHSPPYC